MDPNATRPMMPATVLYRCSCGNQLQLDATVGGKCDKCLKTISPKLLSHDLAMTMTIHEGSFELDQNNTDRAGKAGPEQVDDFAATIDNSSAQTMRDDENPEILIGEKFGHFEIVSTLGRGGMGQVYRALDTSLQRYVAVKLLRSGIGRSGIGTSVGTTKSTTKSSDEEVDKLMQEAVSQARVTHPNIVTIYYVGKQGEDPFLAMELVNGKPLNDYIAADTIPFHAIVNIALQIADALKFSYELDIIHGDIKPSNVLVQHDGVAKLSDFGMARRASFNHDDAIGGTPNYIAPELLHGEKPSRQSDMYALGVTLYEMSFGELPITMTGKTISEWIANHQKSDIEFPMPWPEQMPEQWRNVMTKMLANDPSDRYADYDELIYDLKEVAPGSQVIARIFPRIVAAGFDWISVMVLAIVLKVALGFASWEQMLAQRPFVTFLLKTCDFIPILVFLIIVYFWRQSVGRSLMHIRVANKYGLRLNANRMVLRSLIRMQFPWFAICLSVLNDPTNSWYGVTFMGLAVVSGLVLLLDIGIMAVYGKGRSLHDFLLDTRVVLDTRSN